ncbi:ATP-dependent RNA helicase HrpA [Luteimonas soli]|uniref:ATP-dependent RNA helicase HrpA n=1 Tax=Luteimonas soli TaxID=1648966 RepID=A0ABV7XJP2_9GAMM
MKPKQPNASMASRPAQRAIDDACSRDAARLHGLLRRWQAVPGDTGAQAAFEQGLAQSVQRRRARAERLPRAVVDPALPIAAHADDIIALIRDNPVVVIAGETGSGKTTQLPKLCLAAGRGAAGMIACTQPRRIAARAVARRVAEELQVPLGGAVGFQVRFSDNVSADTAVKFMTDGILLAEIASDRWLSAYDTIIIDEAHERSLNIDFLLGYLKQLLHRRRDLKVIVTSATIDTERFAAHFGGAPVVNVEGRGHPVEVRYRPLGSESLSPGDASDHGRTRGESDSDPISARSRRTRGESDPDPVSVLDGVLAACDEIARERPMGDTLVFLPGEREIRDAHRALERRKYRHTEVLPLYARLSARDQDRVFNPGPQRRIVLATNVAETSLTVPRIHYVVDPGLARVKRYSPRLKLDRLHVEPVSQASADQRKGRCGRVAPGTCYRIYSEADFQSRAPYTDPEIRRAALAGVILRMLSLGLGGEGARGGKRRRGRGDEQARGGANLVEDFPFIDPPDPRAIADGWQQLAELGAVDDRRRLTPTGRTMAKLPVDVKLARMLVAAQAHGCLHEMLAIASFLGIQDPRERPADQRAAADTAHAQFRDPRSEFVGILRLWDAYRTAHEDMTQLQLRKWCDRNFLGFLRMREWRELHRQLKLQCEELWGRAGLDPPPAQSSSAAGRDPPYAKRGEDPSPAPARNRQRRKQAPAPPEEGAGDVRLSAAAHVALHRALIAGLPTQLGHRTERGQYEGPRGRRFQLFPGSPLASKPPPWVLSATLLDTEKVWSLTNAAIEPEWAMAELPHLLARRHFDPRWSRSQGRVIGSEQVSLFGLVLAPKKPVHYGGLYPEESRDIFVRDGLVAGEINTRSAFVARNRKTLARAEEEEAKQRRAGLVVDEEWMAQWYRDRIPSDIVSAQALDAWYAKLPINAKQALEWTREDLLVADGADADLFPAYIALGDARLAVRYRFEPGAVDDGMTVVVPLHLLNALDPPRLSWLAPGFVADKAAAMIRILPKALRRNFVPAPDFARAFAEAHGAADADTDAFAGTLARFLKRMTGVELAGGDFDESALEPHLRANLRLLDVDGRSVLAESRDLDELRTRFGARARDAFAARASEGLAQGGLTEFPDEPIPESVPGAGGVPAYPALHDHGDSVSLDVHADRDEARRHHPRGVRRLLALALADRMRQARKQLPVSPKTALLYAAIESAAPRASQPGRPADHLRDDLVDGAFAALAADGLGDIRDPDTFAARRDALGKALFGEAMARLQQAETILGLVAEVRAKLDSRLVGWARGNLDDMQAQLAALVPRGFLRDVPATALAEYPRYLKALATRAQRALNDPPRDQQRMLDLKPFTDALADAEAAGLANEPEWQALRWDIEELRVSLFAQELGAKGGVSPKKLAARIAALRRG